MSKFVARYSNYVQVGPENFKMIGSCKVFEDSVSIREILEWVESLGEKQPHIVNVEFNYLDED